MAVFDIFSKRQKRSRGEIVDVYVYDKLPQAFRVQIVHILSHVLGAKFIHDKPVVERAFQAIIDILRKEYGVFHLPPRRGEHDGDCAAELFNFFLNQSDVEKCIDVIELSFRAVDEFTRDVNYLYIRDYDDVADDAIAELNDRFKEHGIGFQYVDREIIRVDSELIHVEAVKPALRLLNSQSYKGAQDEFINAYDHYRHGKHKEALNECLKSFESTMKAICAKRGWAYNQTDTAKQLIDVCFQNGLIPPFWQSQLSSLRSLLESSIPVGRNKLSGHGQGATPSVVPSHIAAYMLHMTASTLVFLTSAEESLP